MKAGWTLCVGISLLFLGNSCKKKVIVQDNNTVIQSSANAMAVSSNQWQGLSDQVDPTLGKIKNIE